MNCRMQNQRWWNCHRVQWLSRWWNCHRVQWLSRRWNSVVALHERSSLSRRAKKINWLKDEGYKFPVLAVVDNLVPMELIDVMCDWGSVNIIQRPAIYKQLVEMVDKYASTENVMFFLDNTLIRRKSADFRGIEQSIEKIGATNANVIIFGEIGMDREQVAREIYEHRCLCYAPSMAACSHVVSLRSYQNHHW